jgi:dTDP-4-dehydrorhamnose 3,5-epimerase
VIFQETILPGAFLITPERVTDERGFFARTFCAEEFRARGLVSTFVQGSISFTLRKGTLRGMHYQAAPHAETKLVRCTLGAVYDVIVDLRPESPTFRRWCATELTAANRVMLYIPAGLAHGFQTLVDSTEVFYQMTEFYCPGSTRGVRWDSPGIGIAWPLPARVLSARDAALPEIV